jgi:broad specificity phosphatase PhoE
VERIILARHGESIFSAKRLVNGDITVAGPLTARGEEEARRLGESIAGEAIDVCVTSEFERTRQTADLALGDRNIPRLVVPELNDPRYGDYEGCLLDDYRTWASGAASGDEAPGGGESRGAIVERYARGFRRVLELPQRCALVVVHSLPIAYVLAARKGDPPGRRVPLVEHAHAYPFSTEELEGAVGLLEGWVAAPTW